MPVLPGGGGFGAMCGGAELPVAYQELLATCHGLAQLGRELVGDPLDQRLFEATGAWALLRACIWLCPSRPVVACMWVAGMASASAAWQHHSMAGFTCNLNMHWRSCSMSSATCCRLAHAG